MTKINRDIFNAINLLIDSGRDRLNYPKLVFLLAEYDDKISIEQILEFVESRDPEINKIDLFAGALYFATKYPDKFLTVTDRIIDVIKRFNNTLDYSEKLKHIDIFLKTITLIAEDDEISADNFSSFINIIFNNEDYKTYKISVLSEIISNSNLPSTSENNKIGRIRFISKIIQAITNNDDKIRVLARSIISSKIPQIADIVTAILPDDATLINVLSLAINYNPSVTRYIFAAIPADIVDKTEVLSQALNLAATEPEDPDRIERIKGIIGGIKSEKNDVIIETILNSQENQIRQVSENIISAITDENLKNNVLASVIYRLTAPDSNYSEEKINSFIGSIPEDANTLEIFAQAICSSAKKEFEESLPRIENIVELIPEELSKINIFAYAISLSVIKDGNRAFHRIANIINAIPDPINKDEVIALATCYYAKETRSIIEINKITDIYENCDKDSVIKNVSEIIQQNPEFRNAGRFFMMEQFTKNHAPKPFLSTNDIQTEPLLTDNRRKSF